jgi:MFS family permease
VVKGVGASVPCLFTLGAELFPMNSRGFYLSVIARLVQPTGPQAAPSMTPQTIRSCSFWMVGSIYAAVAAWVILGDDLQGNRIMPDLTWGVFLLVAALPVFVTLGLVLLVLPDSPRYLLSKGRYTQAAKVLERWALLVLWPTGR